MADNIYPYLNYYQNLCLNKIEYLKVRCKYLYENRNTSNYVLNKVDYYTIYFDSTVLIQIYDYGIVIYNSEFNFNFYFNLYFNLFNQTKFGIRKSNINNETIHIMFQNLFFFIDKQTKQINEYSIQLDFLVTQHRMIQKIIINSYYGTNPFSGIENKELKESTNYKEIFSKSQELIKTMREEYNGR